MGVEKTRAWFKDCDGNRQTAGEWVKDISPEDRATLYNALAPYFNESAWKLDCDGLSRAFTNAEPSERKKFLKIMETGISAGYAAMGESQFDHFLQAELDRLNKKATSDAWDRSVADAKARAEKAKKEAAA